MSTKCTQPQMSVPSLARKHTQPNTSLLSCVARHAMRSTWLKSGVVHNLLSDKSVPQRELMERGGRRTVPPRLSCLSAVMRSPSRSPCRVSWFKDHKMFELKNPLLLKTSSHGGMLSINQLLSPRRAALTEGKEMFGTSFFLARMKPLTFFVVF